MARKSKAKTMGRPPLPEEQRKGEAVTMRVDPETARRLEAVAEVAGLGRSTMARACLLAGLDLAERNPARVLKTETER
jgi:predicted transcriptional regulator